MPVVTHHSNTEVDQDIQDLFAYTPSPEMVILRSKIIDSLNETDPSRNLVDDIISAGVIEDSGYIGRFLSLARLHIDQLLRSGVIPKQDAGEFAVSIINNAMNVGLSASIEANKNKEEKLKEMTSALRALTDMDMLGYEAKIKNYTAEGLKFELDHIKPLERESLKEDVESKHIKHDIDSYTLDNILPKNANSLSQDIDLKELDKAKKSYENTNFLPLQETLLAKDGSLKQAQIDNVRKDINIKDLEEAKKIYENTNFLPLQGTILLKDGLFKQSQIDNVEKDIDLKVLDETKKTYENINFLPLQKIILANDGLLKNSQIENANADKALKQSQLTELDYKNTYFLPLQKDILSHEVDIKLKELSIAQNKIDLLVAQIAKETANSLLLGAEKGIKEYYNTYIQPCEKRLSCAKATLEETNAGVIGNDNLAALRMAQLKIQTELYVEQRNAFADVKNQKVLDSALTYHAMVFADLDTITGVDVAAQCQTAVTSKLGLL